MQHIKVVNGNRMWTGQPTHHPTTLDGWANYAVSELRRLGQVDAAQSLACVGLEWYDRPWQIERVIRWEAALIEALQVPELSRMHQRGLLYVLARVTNWLAEYTEVHGCHFMPDDPVWGWHLMTNWDDAQPGDILYGGELWMACRQRNWDDGKPLFAPDGAIEIKGYGLNAIPWDKTSND